MLLEAVMRTKDVRSEARICGHWRSVVVLNKDYARVGKMIAKT